ncbi:hypothetical protein EVC45_29375 [Paraburkholderia sp. UYCP14C]|uniref:hypothetical protein n=1 Tax=Paraburkholderia sp. UYCP14C TaxID=2511130 RepID=UPI001020127C|nr:hypothetical protein [Paraburkholderia sp. UYCP14C]RZF26244.1 hypothetical protein EVC45_29375 [Paraburkholderia sp. UYCP14C]
MSQTRGRYAGPRDSGQRQPRHAKKSPSNRQGQPYVKAPPRDSSQTASIFKTRSFQFLVDAVGAENIALGLESNMTRVAELMKGERFTPETAFHMETTLGLPHGFFDQPHPTLAPETIARLKSPLDFVNADNEPELTSEALMPASVPNGSQQSILEDNLSEETEMPKKATGGSPVAVKKSQNQMARQTGTHTRVKGSSSKSRAASEATQQQPLALDDSVTVENVRRHNLHVLTGRNGSKARLGVVMSMTGSNMAHRLYGKKRMDDVEAIRFTERLGLPAGWLDTPRSEAEIPESVSRLLTPASRSRGSGEHREPIVAASTDDARGKRVTAKTHTRRAQAAVAIETQSASPASAEVVEEKEAIVVSEQDHISGAPAEASGRSSSEGSDETLSAVTSATLESLPPAALPQQNLAPLPASTSLDNLHGIAPIAEALIKTLAGKARTGRLDELKALELLQQAVLL